MQKAEHSVPLEKAAGSIPFQGLLKPPGQPGPDYFSMKYVPVHPAGTANKRRSTVWHRPPKK